ncbi:hypothetical protein EYF80_043818 [Liparis tanakae]|uniref:Uncharacterized protein n=1 Tax=Liparis tanakae TaxID=230148 RepID=A0A4Z2FXR2_9TELE|nr:hypothetical protein EYF80_043818 [Liparis tanakae]
MSGVASASRSDPSGSLWRRGSVDFRDLGRGYQLARRRVQGRGQQPGLPGELRGAEPEGGAHHAGPRGHGGGPPGRRVVVRGPVVPGRGGRVGRAPAAGARLLHRQRVGAEAVVVVRVRVVRVCVRVVTREVRVLRGREALRAEAQARVAGPRGPRVQARVLVQLQVVHLPR